MGNFREKLSGFLGTNQEKLVTEEESIELKLTNDRLKPFKVKDKVRIIPLGRESMNLDDGWIIDGYSQEYKDAILHKLNTEGYIPPDADPGSKPPKYLHDRASIKLLIEWNPEYDEWD